MFHTLLNRFCLLYSLSWYAPLSENLKHIRMVTYLNNGKLLIGSISTDNQDDIQSITSTDEDQNITSIQESNKDDLVQAM